MNGRLYQRILVVFIILFMLSAACNYPLAKTQPTSPAETSSVQTIDAMMTQNAAGGMITATPVNTAVESADATATTQPTATSRPTATEVVVIPTNTRTPVCDQAGFVADITVPDGSVITAGTSFTKTWRLQNLGSCTWTADYAVVFDAGDGMNGPASDRLGVSVPPGQVVDISVPLKAPGAPGQYRGYWKLRNAAGLLFGLGSNAERFYVDIKVTSAPSSGSGYDFTGNLCLAQWSGNSKTLSCTGKDGNADGFVLYQAHPVLESGYVDDEPALLTNPPAQTDGVIRGKYPAYTVKSGDRFQSIVGCEYNAKKCNVRFQLDYQIDNGAIQTLGSWNEAYEGYYTTVSVDLSGLAGKNVSFILTVLANGASDQDRALWLLPRIAPQAATATPTPTQTTTPTVTPTPTETEPGYPYP